MLTQEEIISQKWEGPSSLPILQFLVTLEYRKQIKNGGVFGKEKITD